LLARLLRNPTVIPSMRRHLVTRGRDRLDEKRVPLGDPPQDEEGRPRSVGGEQFEQRTDAAIDSTLEAVPIRSSDVRLERRHLEVLLDIDGEVVFDRRLHVVFTGRRCGAGARGDVRSTLSASASTSWCTQRLSRA